MNTSHKYLKINSLVLSLQLLGAIIVCGSIGLAFVLYNSPKFEEEKVIAWCGTESLTRAQGSGMALDANAEKGHQLFENNCASCHNIHKVMVGPALKGITERRNMKWIVKWVQNPSKMIASKDPYAVKLAADFKSAGIMTGFPALTQKDIENIVAYISTEQKQIYAVAMP